eukprot:gene6889-9439_t
MDYIIDRIPGGKHFLSKCGNGNPDFQKISHEINSATLYFFVVYILIGLVISILFWSQHTGNKLPPPNTPTFTLTTESNESTTLCTEDQNHHSDTVVLSPMIQQNQSEREKDCASSKISKNPSLEMTTRNSNFPDIEANINQDGPQPLSVITRQPNDLPTVSSTSTTVIITTEYQSVIDSNNKKDLLGIPYFPIMVNSQIFGLLNCLIEILSVGFLVSTPPSNFSGNVYLYTFYYIIASWIAAPIWQRYSIVTVSSYIANKNDSSGASLKHTECGKCGCMLGYCCIACCGLCCCQLMCIPRVDIVRRPKFMPFSIYNNLFMVLNPGKELNPKLPIDMEQFDYGTVLMFLHVVGLKGALNFFVFVNFMNQILSTTFGDNVCSDLSLIFSIISLFLKLLNLKIYFITLLFGTLIVPFTVVIQWLIYCPDCCCLQNTVTPKRGTTFYALLETYWAWSSHT